jgi:YD repeat-containing protein
MSTRSTGWARSTRSTKRCPKRWTSPLLALVFAAALWTPAAADVIYIYDDVGRLTGVIDAAGDSAGYRYDAVGNLVGIQRAAPGGPAITSFTPATGGIGAAVTISGTGFGAGAGDNKVTFNGVPAVLTSSTATRIVATVPVGAATGPLTVTTPAASVRSGGVFTVTAPDLVPTALTAPTVVSPRQPITVSWTVTNRGTGSAVPRWNDFVYLSTDSVCCAVDEIVAAVELTAVVGAGQSYTRTQTVTVPRVPAGQYYLIVSTDDARVLPEADKANNRRVLPITVRTPELVPTALTAPATWVRGQTVSVSWTVKNQGDGTVYSTSDALYLAPVPGPACCDHARFLGRTARTIPLAPGATYSQQMSLKVPDDDAPGQYSLVLLVDDGQFVTEADESNNRREIPISVAAANLVITAFTAPAALTTQQSVTVSWTVKNEGDAAATLPWNDRVSLSTTAFCCAGNPVVATATRPVPLAPGASYTATKLFIVPNVPAGSYFLHVNADDGLAISESDEANNHRTIPIAVTTPDLVAAGLTAPASVRGQQVVSLGWTVSNSGSGAAKAPWMDIVYLSSDQTCCAGDTALATVSHTAALAPGASYAQTKSVTIPVRPPGSYFLILKVDAGGAVYEANESNNLRVVPLTIAP